MIWVLILFAHAGPLSDKDSMAMTTVPGFTTQAECQAAGDQAEGLATRTTKVIKHTCVKVEK